VIRGDAARDGRLVHVKGAAQSAGQATAVGAQLLASTGHADLQSGERNRAVAGSGADVQGGSAQEHAGAGADGEGNRLTGAQADARVVAEGVASFEHRLRAQGRAVGGRAGLGDENQLGGSSGADRNSAGVGAGQARGAESQGDVGGDVVGQ